MTDKEEALIRLLGATLKVAHNLKDGPGRGMEGAWIHQRALDKLSALQEEADPYMKELLAMESSRREKKTRDSSLEFLRKEAEKAGMSLIQFIELIHQETP